MVDLADQPVRLDAFAGRVVVPNAGDETFAALRLDDQSWSGVEAGLSGIESPLTRAVLWWTAIDRAQSRELGLDRLVDLADTHLRPERHPVVLEAVLGFLQTVVRRYATPEQVGTLLERISDIARGGRRQR